MALAKRLNFRTKSVQGLPVERRARHLAQLPDVSDALAGRALIAYHFAHERPLMAAFLDALGIAHEDGLITAEDVPSPLRQRSQRRWKKLAARSLKRPSSCTSGRCVALDGDTWVRIDGLLHPTD